MASARRESSGGASTTLGPLRPCVRHPRTRSRLSVSVGSPHQPWAPCVAAGTVSNPDVCPCPFVVIFLGVVTLRVMRPDGRVDRVPVTDHGGAVACAFGRVGFRSAIWTVTVTAEGIVTITPESRIAGRPVNGPDSGSWPAPVVRRHTESRPIRASTVTTIGNPLVDGHEPATVGGAPHITMGPSILVLPPGCTAVPGRNHPT